MKPNNQTKYVNKKSNHPRNIIKAIPSSVNQRLSNISSDIKQFNDTKKPYQDALKDAGYDYALEFKPPNMTKMPVNPDHANVNATSCGTIPPSAKMYLHVLMWAEKSSIL